MLTRIEGQDGNCWEGREARREFLEFQVEMGRVARRGREKAKWYDRHVISESMFVSGKEILVRIQRHTVC